MTPMTRPPVITVSLQDLKDGNISLESLEQAFGPDSLGIILVKDLPSHFAALRSKLLSLSSCLANLPAEELARVERPEARFNVGWSHGKEKLDSGLPDLNKGSYYAQPVHDEVLEAKARQLYPDLPDMTLANVWPDEKVLPGFASTFEELCRMIVEVAALVARSCDRFGVAKVEGYRDGTLEGIVKTSISTKARLLHYFPPPRPANVQDRPDAAWGQRDDDWCGTHIDLGALTGLTSNMFVDEAAHPPKVSTDGLVPDLPERESHPDPKAGLWIKDRSGRSTQVNIPRDCLAFQTGQALEKMTRGRFRAVPHFVRGGAPELDRNGSIARNTLAVFTQPNLWEVVDEESGLDFAGLARKMFAKTY